MNIDKSIPATNLVAHQKLLAWYAEANKLNDAQLCPLLCAVPGDWSFRTLPCDIPLTRALYVKETGRSCHLGASCCARVKYLEQASNELTGEPLRKMVLSSRNTG